MISARTEGLALKPTQSRLLDLIRRHAPVTRAELVRLSNLTAGTITQQCRELIFSGLVVEGERNTGQRGQPSLPLHLNPGGGCAVGLAFNPGSVDMTVVDLRGRRLLTVSEPHQENESLSVTLVQIKRMVEDTLKKRQLQNARLLGIGYAIPGYLKGDGRKRQCVSWLHTWSDIDLQQAFADSLPWPAWVENNANASAVGELYCGNWNDYHDLTFIDLGYGIGAGIIAGGKLLKGGFSNAGEIGTEFPNNKPRPSYKNLLETLEFAGLQNVPLDKLLQQKTPELENWLVNCSKQVLQSVRSCIRWLDPQLIILGGSMPITIISRLAQEISQQLSRELHAERPSPRIVPSALAGESASYGAAMIPLYQVINEDK